MPGPSLFRDLAERAIRAFVAAFVGVLTAGQATDISTLRGVALAAVAAGVSAVISIVASRFGVPGSASLDSRNAGAR